MKNNLNSVGASLIMTGVLFMSASKLLDSAKSHLEIAKLDREVG